jgi:CheY-like chemotaxis protein
MIKAFDMNGKGTLLIVDDDSRNIFALTAVLKAKGFVILAASSAKEGLQLLRANKGIQIVLMDMMMPGMDGYEALAEIRMDASLQKMPVIAVTAQAMTGDREKCLEAGADDYISKPIDVDLLVKLLDEYKLKEQK